MGSQPATGRWLVVAVIVLTLTLSVALAIDPSNLAASSARLRQQIVRLLLISVLSVFLYSGANWARWVGGIFFALAGLASILGAIGAWPDREAFVFVASGVIYFACAGILLLVESVRRHFGVLRGGS